MTLTAPLYLLRHGETAWNLERRMQGSKDSALTARGRDREMAEQAGADRFMTKPFSNAEILAEVRAMLARPRRAG